MIAEITENIKHHKGCTVEPKRFSYARRRCSCLLLDDPQSKPRPAMQQWHCLPTDPFYVEDVKLKSLLNWLDLEKYPRLRSYADPHKVGHGHAVMLKLHKIMWLKICIADVNNSIN